MYISLLVVLSKYLITSFLFFFVLVFLFGPKLGHLASKETYNKIMRIKSVILFSVGLLKFYLIDIWYMPINSKTFIKINGIIMLIILILILAFPSFKLLYLDGSEVLHYKFTFYFAILSLICSLIVLSGLLDHLRPKTSNKDILQKKRELKPATAEQHRLSFKYSAVGDIVLPGLVAYGTASALVRYSAYIFAVGIYLTMFSTHIKFLSVTVLLGIMEHMFEHIQEIIAYASDLLHSQATSETTLIELHQYLTPYVRSYQSILFNLLIKIAKYLENWDHPEAYRIRFSLNLLLGESRILMMVYRLLEEEIGISLDISPIPDQPSEY